jgi:hypothetical protein
LKVIGKREAKEKGVWKLDEAQAKFVTPFVRMMMESLFKHRADINSSFRYITSG